MTYSQTFPDGTIRARDLPANYQAELQTHVNDDGTLKESAGPVYGNYLEFAQYKVRVTIVPSDTTKVKLA